MGEAWHGTRPTWPFLLDIDRVLECDPLSVTFKKLKGRLERGRLLHRPPPGTEQEYLERLRYGCEARHKAATWFKSGVPEAAWKLAVQVYGRQWHLLAMFSRVPESMELAQSHFQLAYLLSACWWLNGITHPYCALPAIVRRRRTQIAARDSRLSRGDRGDSELPCRWRGEPLLSALSCKRRGVCPSCNARRMHNTAAHLVDRVFSDAPLRQWVVTRGRVHGPDSGICANAI